MLLFHIVLVLLQVHETWSAQEESTYTQQHCAPSSCGNIHNISYPFALKSQPENCGDPRYKLWCENNQTVLYLYAGKYNVREISYSNYRIRVSDSGIQENDNFSLIPHYFLRYENFSSGDPYVTEFPYNSEGPISESISSVWNFPGKELSHPAVFVKCQKPANSSFYVNISDCFNSSLSDFERYRYIQVRTTSPEQVEDTCRSDQISLSTGKTFYPENTSCADAHNDILLHGFELSWHQVYCGSCAGGDGICYLDGAYNIFRCYTLINEGKCYKLNRSHIILDFSWSKQILK